MGSATIPYKNTAVVETAVLVRTGICSLAGYHLFNPGSAPTYIQFFDAAAAADVTVTGANAVFLLGLPLAGGATRSLNRPLKFTLGMVIACTSNLTNGAPQTANVVELDVGD